MAVVAIAPAAQGCKSGKKNKSKMTPISTSICKEPLTEELLQKTCPEVEERDADSIESGSTTEPATTAASLKDETEEETEREEEEESKEEESKEESKSKEEETKGSEDRPGKKDLEFLKVVNIGSQDPKIKALLKVVTALSDAIFHEDCLEDCTKKKGWKLSILTNKEQSIMCGFIVTKVTVTGSLAVGKLAVPGEFRGAGYGRKIMEEVVKDAKRQKGVYDVSLSSLPGAISFYQRIGFKAHWGLKLTKDNEGYVEGQVYMEKLLARRPRKQ